MGPIKNRYEFIVLFDVENGNPNGDPDAGNMPRVDPETSHGIITDVCLKRKIRNYVELAKRGDAGYGILVKGDKALNDKFAEAYDSCGLEKGKKGKNIDDVALARDYICRNYFDARTFGAVMSTGDNPCGIVRGPVQMGFAQSVDPVYPQELTITRQAITKASDVADKGKTTEMGKKAFVPYGLYRVEGYISALLAQDVTGFSEEDLELLWNAIENMFEHDRSAARGKMTVRKLFVFEHDSVLGNAPAGLLFEKVEVKKKAGVDVPRSFKDYDVFVDTSCVDGVKMDEKIHGLSF
jgi:CRISPR-associated protein Csd2